MAEPASPQTGSYSYQGNQIPDARFHAGETQNFAGNAYNPYQAQPEDSPKKDKKRKKEHRRSTGLIALLVVFTVLLSGAAGFAGSLFANRFTATTDGGGTKLSTSVVYRAPEGDSAVTVDGNGNTEVSVAQTVSPSVVEITTETVVTSTFYGQYVTGGAGSGVILTEDGYIITCAHVVSGASTITVKLTNGESYKATLRGSDAQSDIAVLKIDVTGLPGAVLGDSSALCVGETAVAVGNPLGSLGGTVTSGIISALERQITIDGQSYTLIQTSAAINPGNSGGGLFNAKGQLVGIVNAKSSGSNIEGLGFAIPINTAMDIAEQLMEFGYVKGRPALGIHIVNITQSTSLDSLLASDYAAIRNYITQYGLYFTNYMDGQSGDLQFGDRLVAINGVSIENYASLKSLLQEHKVGETVQLTVARIDDINSRHPRVNMVDVSVTLIEQSAQ